jgi:hypothetical protein
VTIFETRSSYGLDNNLKRHARGLPPSGFRADGVGGRREAL